MLELREYFAGGQWLRSSGAASQAVINPADNMILGTGPDCTADDVDCAVRAASRALPGWAATETAERRAVLARLRDELATRADEAAMLITRQVGVPISFSRAVQLGLPLRSFDTFLGIDFDRETALGRSQIVRDPVGVVGAITPWNFPLHQIVAKAVPAMLAGCTVVLKPSQLTPFDAALLARLSEVAGVPPGVFNVIFGAAQTGEALVVHPAVDLVSFTGSTAAGRRVGALAGGHLKRSMLELGGKSASVVLDDADLEKVVPAALGQCFVNAGQTCAALTRLLVPQRSLERVLELCVNLAPAWAAGPPEQESTRLGPLASQAQQQRVRAMVSRALAQGAQAVVGGLDAPSGCESGAYVQATVLAKVDPTSEIAQEEIFGPVLAVIGYADESEAVAIANGTPYGLSGGVWSADADRARAFARRLRTGHVCLNGASLDLAAPFGGVGRSGYGREYGRVGLDEFFSLKSITGSAA